MFDDKCGTEGQNGFSGSLGTLRDAEDANRQVLEDTAASGIGSQENDERREPLFYDALFRRKHKRGSMREVSAPCLTRPIADTHTHMHLLADPSLNLARCAFHNVTYLVDIVDICEDRPDVFDVMARACEEAPQMIRRIVEDAASCGGDAGRASWQEGGVTANMPSVPEVRFAIGCHPHNAKDYSDAVEESLRRAVQNGKAAAIGEIGLDYHYDFSPRDVQRQVFRRQLHLAHELDVPVSLHIREAHDEAFEILQEEGPLSKGTVLHCFNLDQDVLAPWMDAGCYIAFGGPLTFKKADEVRASAALVPEMRLLTETDAPYMTPEPMRGMTCGPEHVIFTAAKLLEVRGATDEDTRRSLLDTLMENARRVFG